MNTPTKVGIGLVSLILICGGTPLFFFAKSDIPEAAGKMKENLAKARQAGLWTTKKEFLDHYSVPSGQNSAGELKKLIAFTDPVLKNAKLTKSSGEVDHAEVKSLYKKLDPEFSRIDEMRRFKYCRFQRDYSRLPYTLLPEYAQLKVIAKLLSIRASMAADENDVGMATRCWERIEVLREAVRQEPIIIADLINTSISAMTTRSLQYTLNTRGNDPAWQTAVRQAIELHDKPHEILLALKGELVYSFDSTDLFMRNPTLAVALTSPEGDSSTDYKYLPRVPRIRQATISRYAEVYARAASKISPNPRNQPAIQDAFGDIDYAFMGPGLSRKIPSLLAPIFGQWGTAVSRDYAYYAVLKNALARLQNREFKSNTIDLDLKPLRSKRTSQGLVIYSIGQNRKDDGGDLSPTQPGSQTTKDFGVLIPK